MSQQNWAKDYLTFNKKDRIGAFIFVAFVAVCIFLPGLFSKNSKSFPLTQDSVLVLAMDTLQQRQAIRKSFDRGQVQDHSYQYEPSLSKGFTAGELFPFDPNTISLNDWQRLGLNERTSKTILKYVSKGGKFYKPEDLQKIWDMPQGFYDRVKDYVAITSIQREYSQNNFSKPAFERTEWKPSIVQINEADTSAFIALPGIGSRLSARIIAFREKLGGFYTVDQIAETYGLPDSTFQIIKSRLQADTTSIRKININTATKDELKTHPYIRWNLANAIVEYRNQHGNFKDIEQLKNIILIDEKTFQRIRFYISL